MLHYWTRSVLTRFHFQFFSNISLEFDDYGLGSEEIVRKNNYGENMHIAIALFTIFSAWRWADRKNWRNYHPTMLFITSGGLLYEFLTKNHSLWVFHPDFLYNQSLVVLIYAVITMPLCVLIFLSCYPKTWTKQVVFLLLWISIFVATEGILELCGRISYQHGWSFWHSVLFDIMMFPMLRLHHLKPIRAYIISIIIIVILMVWLKVPLDGGAT